MESKLPVGFPAPTPVGEIEVKSYPTYRMAKTASSERGNNAEFRLKAADPTVGIRGNGYIHSGSVVESGELHEMVSKSPGKEVSELTIDDVRFKENLMSRSWRAL